MTRSLLFQPRCHCSPDSECHCCGREAACRAAAWARSLNACSSAIKNSSMTCTWYPRYVLLAYIYATNQPAGFSRVASSEAPGTNSGLIAFVGSRDGLLSDCKRTNEGRVWRLCKCCTGNIIYHIEHGRLICLWEEILIGYCACHNLLMNQFALANSFIHSASRIQRKWLILCIVLAKLTRSDWVCSSCW